MWATRFALARLATKVEEPVVVMCGVHFMAETVKMLAPGKTVLEPAPDAGCSLADSCGAEEFRRFIEAHPGHTVVSYVNTSAAVKALTDIVVTSGNAREVIESLPADEKIIFGPDRNLGSYINKISGREMVLWDGACHVHEQFSLEKILELKERYPDALVLVHPECPAPIRLYSRLHRLHSRPAGFCAPQRRAPLHHCHRAASSTRCAASV